MARPRTVTGGRSVMVSVRMSQAEAAALDRVRGGYDRSTYLRRLLKAAATRAEEEK